MKHYYLFFFIIYFGCSLNKNIENPKVRGKKVKVSALDLRRSEYYFYEALNQKSKSNLADALQGFMEAFKYNNANTAALFEAAKIYLLTDNKETGIKYIENIIDENPDNPWYAQYLANFYINEKRFVDAERIYNKLYNIQPKNIEYLYTLSRIALQNKNFQTALNVLDEIERIDGINEQISLDKQLVYIQLGDKKNSLKEINTLLKENPRDPRYHVILGDLYMDFNDSKKAIKNYNKALELNPKYGPAYISLSAYYKAKDDSVNFKKNIFSAFNSENVSIENLLSMLINMVVEQDNLQISDETNKTLFEILNKKYPDNDQVKFYYGNYLLSKGKIIEGNICLNEAVALNPLNGQARLQLMENYFRMRNFDKVDSVFNESVKYVNNNPRIYYLHSLSQVNVKNFLEGIESAKSGLRFTGNKDQDIALALTVLIADSYFQLQNKDSTLVYYKKAYSINPNDAGVLNNYSYYLCEFGVDLDLAENMSSKSISLDPDNSTFLDTYAWILFQKNEIELAKFYMEMAIEKLDESEMKNPVYWEHYGDILFKEGSIADAIKNWKKALEYDPDNEIIKQKINNIL